MDRMGRMDSKPPMALFPVTHWSVVLAAGGRGDTSGGAA